MKQIYKIGFVKITKIIANVQKVFSRNEKKKFNEIPYA